jgi:hypothetical protein
MLSGEGGDFSLGNAMNRWKSAMVPCLSFALVPGLSRVPVEAVRALPSIA